MLLNIIKIIINKILQSIRLYVILLLQIFLRFNV